MGREDQRTQSISVVLTVVKVVVIDGLSGIRQKDEPQLLMNSAHTWVVARR